MMFVTITLSVVILAITLFSVFSERGSKLRRLNKYIWIFIISALVCFTLVFKWVSDWSPQAKRADQNVRNSKRLIKGMQKKDMFEIMGEPDKSKLNPVNGDSIYFYLSPFGASTGISIELRNDSIHKINYYE